MRASQHLGEHMFEQIELFQGLSERELKALEDNARVKKVAKHVVIINEGDETDALYVVLDGAVKVFLTDEQGREVIVSMNSAGSFFGELALLGHDRRSASVMSTEPSRFAVVPGAIFLEYMGRFPRLAMNMAENLARRLKVTTESVRSFALFGAYQRLTDLLIRLAKEREGKLVVSELPTQQTLASMIGSSRETVNRILKDLATGGYLSVEEKSMIIHKSFPEAY